MKFTLKTPKGPFTYKLQIVYEGIKYIDKPKAKENLLLFKKIAERNNLTFGIIFGTMLGAMREHDFITHDEDIDLFILDKDRDKFKSMLFELRENGFELIRWDRRNTLCSVMRQGEYLDIYIFDKLTEDTYETVGHPCPSKYLENLAPVDFQGDKFLGPAEAEEYLYYQFGKNWRTPLKTKDFGMSWTKKIKLIFQWYCYFLMPDFIFVPWLEKRAIKHLEGYNRMANRTNDIVGKHVLNEVPLDCYHIKLDE